MSRAKNLSSELFAIESRVCLILIGWKTALAQNSTVEEQFVFFPSKFQIPLFEMFYFNEQSSKVISQTYDRVQMLSFISVFITNIEKETNKIITRNIIQTKIEQQKRKKWCSNCAQSHLKLYHIPINMNMTQNRWNNIIIENMCFRVIWMIETVCNLKWVQYCRYACLRFTINPPCHERSNCIWQAFDKSSVNINLIIITKQCRILLVYFSSA